MFLYLHSALFNLKGVGFHRCFTDSLCFLRLLWSPVGLALWRHWHFPTSWDVIWAPRPRVDAVSCYQLLPRLPVNNEPRLSFHKLEQNSMDSYPQEASMNTPRTSDCPAVRCVSAGLLSPLPAAFHMLMALPSTRPIVHTRHTTFPCPLSAWKTSAWQQPASFGCLVSMVTVQSTKVAGGALRKEQMGEEKMWREVHSGDTIFPRCFTPVRSVVWAVSWKKKNCVVASVFELFYSKERDIFLQRKS